MKAARRARAQAHAEKGVLTGLRADELCSPRSYVVEADFAKVLGRLNGLAERHVAELDQWEASEKVTPTLGALMALLRPFHGLPAARRYSPGDRRALCGVGVQVPLRFKAKAIGRDKSTICDALELGDTLGLIRHYAPLRRVADVTANRPADQRCASIVTKDGVERARVNTHGITYLTPAGAAWLDARGITWDDLGRRKARLRGTRARVLTGILGEVFDLTKKVCRHAAKRLLPSHPTPVEEPQPQRMFSFVVAGPVDNSRANSSVERPLAAVANTGSTKPPPVPEVQFRTALPTNRSTLTPPLDNPSRSTAQHAGLSGKGAFSPPPAETPPAPVSTRPPTALEKEVERCWKRHNVEEGGKPRRFWVMNNLGDPVEVVLSGRVKKWSPALVASEAYPNEWKAARGRPDLRKEIEANFELLIGPRVRSLYAAWEAARPPGEVALCPLEGCDCTGRSGIPRTKGEALAVFGKRLEEAARRRKGQ
ncbi:hypothetical protein FJV41_23890 [Myxococcus llanfairpwllgwyngyllgogerychwyrndrobwllllantysiliogogogochensis]|uniref:Uncharacterized protein n=1 Tax=Myxococcus llanfairpwllgwyngyllgogerychwyrndrobwllllantysiliogogogochensis TaxID=2590453 RepID=A0A540WYD2_9BACT|nr:hypothetical protein [Myxococcus llanfairpwllgwyngyllgogerychwyrndrobwllllantysiliogogogochensis]TQF13434.1 hypothetical protein FJV41_23890 [Myxococcus llanfairpwllgwyngyllgogerychwyrndrobwllllantysiliogogogochensis]